MYDVGIKRVVLTGSSLTDGQALPTRPALNNLADLQVVGPCRQVIPKGGSGEWDENIREIGNVLYQPWAATKKYKLVYSGHQGTYAGNNVYVGLATSENGVTWTKQGPILSRASEDPYMVYKDGIYYLYVEDKEVVPFRNIRLFTSTDLVTWTDRGVVLDAGVPGTWDAQDVSSPVVFIEDGVWYMFYEGRGPNNGGAVGLATSTDGLTWTKYANNPVATANNPLGFPGKSPMVPWAVNLVPDDIIKVDGLYYMIVHAYPYKGAFVPVVLVSTDLVAWKYLRVSSIEKMKTSDGTLMFGADGDYFVVYASSVYGILMENLVGFGEGVVKQYQMPTKRPTIIQMAKDVNIDPGNTAVIETVANSEADEVTFVATCAVAHNFEVRIVERIDNTDPNAWVDVKVSGTGTTQAIVRHKLGATHRIEYRIKNLDTVAHTYNAWREEWY